MAEENKNLDTQKSAGKKKQKQGNIFSRAGKRIAKWFRELVSEGKKSGLAHWQTGGQQHLGGHPLHSAGRCFCVGAGHRFCHHPRSAGRHPVKSIGLAGGSVLCLKMPSGM